MQEPEWLKKLKKWGIPAVISGIIVTVIGGVLVVEYQYARTPQMTNDAATAAAQVALTMTAHSITAQPSVSAPTVAPSIAPAATLPNPAPTQPDKLCGAESIIFESDRTGNFEIYHVAATGGDVARLTDQQSQNISPQWSPFTTEVAFISDRYQFLQILRLDVTNLADGPVLWNLGRVGDIVAFDWLASGTIVFVASANGVYSLHQSDAQSTNAIPINVGSLIEISNPAVSPNGRLVTFQAKPSQSERNEIYWLDLTSSQGPRNVSLNIFEDVEPAWIDNQTLIFASDRDSDYELYSVSIEGSAAAAMLTDNSFSDRQPTVSVNVSHIAFVSDRDGNEEIYTLNLSDANPIARRLTFDSSRDLSPEWCP
jgi:hypothetical protein